MIKKIILSWFALFLLGAYSAMPCYANENLQKFDRLENNITIVLQNVEGYRNSLTKAENELKQSNLQLIQAKQHSKKLSEELLLSKSKCEQMQKDLENANNLLESYEKTMKAKIRKQRMQKYLYAALAVGAIIYSSKK